MAEHMESVNLFQTPQQLVAIGDDGKLVAVQTTLALIRAIKNPSGIGAVVVAGPYHKGKSYLLNRLAKLDPSVGFKVGLHTEAETKGIWVLAVEIKEMTVFLLDSEGIDAPGNKASTDSKVFALSLLLASVFIYNTMSLIEEASLRHLSFITSLAEHINPGAEEAQSITFPQLLWLVRDFQYWKDLEKKYEGSANVYMESILELKGSDTSSMDNNNIREGINKLFPVSKRSCYLLPSPAIETEDLINLSPSEFNPKFTMGLESLINTVLPELIAPKRQGNRLLNGTEYAALIAMCVEAMETDNFEEVTLFIPNIRSKFAMTEALDLYERGLDMDSKQFPISEDELQLVHVARSRAARVHFTAKAYGPTKERLEADLERQLEEKLAVYSSRNRNMRDRAFLGLGNLQNAIVAGVLALLLLSTLDFSTSLLLAGALALSFYLEQFYVITNNLAVAISASIVQFDEHIKPWAEANKQAMAAIIAVLMALLVWLF